MDHSKSRNHNIDAFRVIANWVIVFVHSGSFLSPAFDPDTRLLGQLLNQFVRVATPFFFLAAGYFFAGSLGRGAEPLTLGLKLIKRLALFFAFWCAVYALVPVESLLKDPPAGYAHAALILPRRAISTHFSLFLNGTKVHLWFLPAMAGAIALLAAACRLRQERALAVVAAGLYLFGLIAGAYKATPIGLDLGINTRNGLFFSTIFVTTGFLLHRSALPFSLRQAWGLIAVGMALRIFELLWISGCYGTPVNSIDYLLGTYPFGVGVFLLLLVSTRLGEIHWMVRLSRYSAGVYCAHMLCVELLKAPALAGIHDAWWEIARPFLALALTFALVMAMARVRVLRPVVT